MKRQKKLKGFGQVGGWVVEMGNGLTQPILAWPDWATGQYGLGHLARTRNKISRNIIDISVIGGGGGQHDILHR